MSELDQTIQEIKKSTDYQVNKRILHEKIQTDLHITYNNGLFKVTPELIAFLNSWDDAEIILEDTYNNPIVVKLFEFKELCKQHYYKVMNRWCILHEQLKRERKV